MGVNVCSDGITEGFEAICRDPDVDLDVRLDALVDFVLELAADMDRVRLGRGRPRGRCAAEWCDEMLRRRRCGYGGRGLLRPATWIRIHGTLPGPSDFADPSDYQRWREGLDRG